MPDLEEYRRLIRDAMSELTDQAATGTDFAGLVKMVTAAAVALIRGAECADVMLIDGRDFESRAPTAPYTTELGAIQIELGQGPCLEAAVDDGVIRCPDLATETRWPEFTRAALAVGVRSVLTFHLHAPGHDAGALNIYGSAAGAFNAEDEAIGATLAIHTSAMLFNEAMTGRYEAMLDDCEVIGQATGVLMERMHVDASRAFKVLTERSRSGGTPIRSVADDLVRTS